MNVIDLDERMHQHQCLTLSLGLSALKGDEDFFSGFLFGPQS
jgi:hypothetical protein